jgi:Ni/Fe-hydrogenase subunit HybB-like protein
VNTFLKVLAALIGLCVLLPGLCTLLFGGGFALSALSGSRDQYGFSGLAIPLLIVGALVTWFGIMIFIWTFRRRD